MTDDENPLYRNLHTGEELRLVDLIKPDTQDPLSFIYILEGGERYSADVFLRNWRSIETEERLRRQVSFG